MLSLHGILGTALFRKVMFYTFFLISKFQNIHISDAQSSSLNPNAAVFVPQKTAPRPGYPGYNRTVAGQPIHPGTKQTLITNHVTQLPSHVLQQMYAGK